MMSTRILNFQSIYNTLLICVLIVFIISGCDYSHNKFEKDISGIKLQVKINRFDKVLMNMDMNNYTNSLIELQKTYPAFFQLYIENILTIGKIEDNFYQPQLQGFLKFEGTKKLFSDCMNEFKDINDIENSLTEAFKYYKFYFPDSQIPQVYSFFSEYVYSNITADSILGIGLDMYLGSEHELYPALQIPRYRFSKFRREYMVPNTIKAFAYSKYPEEEITDKSFLSKMIYNGKILYFMDCMLPGTPDSIKIGYTHIQLEWCKLSERSIWAYFIDENILFETDYLKYDKFLKEAPNTSGLPSESAPLLGAWMGWQIVRAYMEKNIELALPDLMNEPDKSGRIILEKSKYKPKN